MKWSVVRMFGNGRYATCQQHMMRLSLDGVGRFTISVDGGALTLAGGEYRVGNLSSSNKSLIPVGGVQNVTGFDALGQWEGKRLSWASATERTRVLMRTTFQQYMGDAGVVVFEQHFPSQIVFGADACSPLPTNQSCFYLPDEPGGEKIPTTAEYPHRLDRSSFAE